MDETPAAALGGEEAQLQVDVSLSLWRSVFSSCAQGSRVEAEEALRRSFGFTLEKLALGASCWLVNIKGRNFHRAASA